MRASCMHSKRFQYKLGLCLAAMVILHGAVAWQEWRLVPIGFPDFSIFYTAGRILRLDRSRLYDDHFQEAVQSSFSPAVERRGSILPFNHPPFEAVFFVPFTAFSYLTAYFLWLAVNLAIVVTLLLRLRAYLANLRVLPAWLWILGGFAFFPVFVSLIQGQDSTVVLLCYAMAFLALQRDSEFAAGAWLAIGLCKFHLLLPFVVTLVPQRRFRLFAGFAAVTVLLSLIGGLAVGWDVLLSYPSYVWHADHAAKYAWNFIHGNNPNWRALVLGILPESRLSQGVVLAGSIILLGISAYLWRRRSSPRDQDWKLGFALSMVATLLVSYHTWVQDMSILLVAVLLVLDVVAGGAQLHAWVRITLWACAALLFCSPLYLVLLLHFSQLRLMAVVLLAFFIAIAAAVKASGNAATSGGIAARPASASKSTLQPSAPPG
jgi:hypothetical protein